MRTLALTLALLAGAAQAQTAREPQSFPADRLRHALDSQGLIDVEWGATPLQAWTWEAAIHVHYISDPLIVEAPTSGETTRLAPLVAHRLTTDLGGSLSILPMLQVGLFARLIVFQSRPDFPTGIDGTELPALTSAGPGDVRVTPKVTVLRSADAGVDLAVLASISAPTGGGSGYRGEAGLTAMPEVAVSRQVDNLRLAFNLGYLVRPRVEFLGLVVDDELQARLGAGLLLGEPGSTPSRVDVSLSTALSMGGPATRRGQAAVELSVLAHQPLGAGLELSFGGGAGVSHGFGNPDLRVLAGFRYVQPGS